MALESAIKWSEITSELLLKQYLTGLKVVDGAGKAQPCTYYEYFLQTAMRKVETITNVSIAERSIEGESHDYHITDYANYAFLQLFHMPVKTVDRISAVYPTGQTIQVFPSEWVRLEAHHGQLHLVPTAGTLGQVIIGQGGDYLPLIYAGVGYLPHLWEVDYTVGVDEDDVPRIVVEAIMKLAAIEILSIASDMVRPIGVTSESVSVDGLSQSQSYVQPAFQGRINRYLFDLYGIEGKQQDLKTTSGLLKQIYDYYVGINLASL